VEWWSDGVGEKQSVGKPSGSLTPLLQHSTTPPLEHHGVYCGLGWVGAGLTSGSASRPSRIFLRTSWAAALISCIFFRTRVPAALFPPVALATSSAASSTNRLSVSYSCMNQTSQKGH